MTFVWTCDRCGRPVADGKGYIHADDREAKRRKRLWEEQKRRDEERSRGEGWLTGRPMDPRGFVVTDLKAGLALPGQLDWEVHHRRCDPHPNRSDYSFGVGRCRTLADLLEWNAHLSSKPWVRNTDWHRFIQRRLAPRARTP